MQRYNTFSFHTVLVLSSSVCTAAEACQQSGDEHWLPLSFLLLRLLFPFSLSPPHPPLSIGSEFSAASKGTVVNPVMASGMHRSSEGGGGWFLALLICLCFTTFTTASAAFSSTGASAPSVEVRVLSSQLSSGSFSSRIGAAAAVLDGQIVLTGGWQPVGYVQNDVRANTHCPCCCCFSCCCYCCARRSFCVCSFL